ncbi:DUF6457 domain-containing protein [Actinoplanes sp. NPDC051343]|uniref:DUF6457 domain-containing protein n=1 Tax=Actinoplanes sp. NPDC051343 TaxID=3363906 RepID=UPI00378A31AA
MNELDAWIAAACTELGLEPGDVKAKAVLDVARDVAHQVIRPGAPVSAYLMGVAVGRGADPSDVAARLSALALSWPKPHADPAQQDAGRNDAGPAQHDAGRNDVRPAVQDAGRNDVRPALQDAERTDAGPAAEDAERDGDTEPIS